MIVTAALTVAARVGLKVTKKLQADPAPSRPPHGIVPLPLALKAPLAEKLEIFIDELLVLLTVTILAALVFPMTTPLNVRLAGEKIKGDAMPPEPVPVSDTS